MRVVPPAQPRGPSRVSSLFTTYPIAIENTGSTARMTWPAAALILHGTSKKGCHAFGSSAPAMQRLPAACAIMDKQTPP